MAEVEPVPLGRPPAGSWLPRVAAVFAIFLAVVVVKPWAPGVLVPSAPTAGPTFYVAPQPTTGDRGRDYDPRLFGSREPDPAWELWPAGYVVQFGIAGPVKVTGQAGASLDPSATGPASSEPTVARTEAPTASAGPSPSTDPLVEHLVDLGPSDHLVALGINTPAEVRVEKVSLWLLEQGRAPVDVAIVRLPTIWESTHFIVIAPEDPTAAGQPAGWRPGRYRLDLLTRTGEVRAVDLVIHPPLE